MDRELAKDLKWNEEAQYYTLRPGAHVADVLP